MGLFPPVQLRQQTTLGPRIGLVAYTLASSCVCVCLRSLLKWAGIDAQLSAVSDGCFSVSNGSLFDHIHVPSPPSSHHWETREPTVVSSRHFSSEEAL